MLPKCSRRFAEIGEILRVFCSVSDSLLSRPLLHE